MEYSMYVEEEPWDAMMSGQRDATQASGHDDSFCLTDRMNPLQLRVGQCHKSL